MTATGFTWFAGNFQTTDLAGLDWLAAHALYLHRGPLVHLVLAYPSGRLAGRLQRAAVAVGYGAAIVTPVWESQVATIVSATLLAAVADPDVYLSAVGPERRARPPGMRAATWSARRSHSGCDRAPWRPASSAAPMKPR